MKIKKLPTTYRLGSLILAMGIFILTVLLSGCGLTINQTIKIQNFGAATEKVGSLGEKEFQKIRSEIIKMKIEIIALNNTKKANSLDLKNPVSVEDTRARIAAVKALQSYGELLIKLASTNRKENIQKAANSFSSNIATTPNIDLPEKSKDMINKLAVGFGTFWISHKKAKSAKEIIPAYESPVDHLADLLVEDFALESDSHGYLKAYWITAQQLHNIAKFIVDSGGEFSPSERYRAVKALALSESSIIYASEMSGTAKGVIRGLKKANSELVKVIKDNFYTAGDIEAYSKEVQELANTLESLKINP
ncbi:hypothetical protein ACJJIU_08175 [Microbulbifer sp. CnH-101-E]|uniref:hypothetical protein n=1 Tax=unclassified Microbulbifer TaxID=2619833 RepID=UPI004039EA76